MPKTRAHRTKLASKPTAADVAVKVDPKLDALWNRLASRIAAAEGEGSKAFDELWESVDEAVHHDPPLYVFGGFKSEADFYRRRLKTNARTAKRNMRVAKYASPKDEETYGVSNLDALLDYLEAKLGTLGARLPVAFDQVKIRVRDGAKDRVVPFAKLTAPEIERARRELVGHARSPSDRTVAAVRKAFAKHPVFSKVHVTARAGFVTLRDVPVASLATFARALAAVELPTLPPIAKPKKAKRK